MKPDLSSSTAAAAVVVVLVQGALLAAAAPVGSGTNAAAGNEHCASEFPAASGELNNFVATGAASKDLKCFFSCLYQANGKMTADGALHFDGGLGPGSSKLPEAIMTAVMPCYKIKPAADLCETAFLHTKCLWDVEKSLQERGSA